MTWSRIVEQATYVTAYRGGLENQRLVVSIPGGQAQLSPEDALTLGQYLTEKAGEILAESLA